MVFYLPNPEESVTLGMFKETCPLVESAILEYVCGACGQLTENKFQSLQNQFM